MVLREITNKGGAAVSRASGGVGVGFGNKHFRPENFYREGWCEVSKRWQRSKRG